MIICMNPLHKDNIYPMDKAMEKIYDEFGQEDGLIQTEVLQYMPGKRVCLSCSHYDPILHLRTQHNDPTFTSSSWTHALRATFLT